MKALSATGGIGRSA
ncbi:hypothetical protein MexAM1_META2p0248 (plasmid) [Methylorubrum extorquens AM1]|uniref:Uncharacterized protein n=1 Tax=Methylorubrum extorquens (strain ATCC 14718 / DSM 1338 / JCM 2805 / NCIMB 9133 / AM1) TaxID=272630 RepID=C5B3W0_METEA|nr:hypothetical protein MexAM1_META2p0248 [Methylorubrum extorquens AM1]